jgi:aminoglycoside phosphotransferase family enzyme
MKTAELPPLICQMTRPAFYPHAVADGEVRLLETHISYVLLAGDYAYKVKKGVDLGFLDFSTLERRRHFCEEEWRLNQRGAPGLYLGVQSICESAPGQYRMGGGGPVVEYAVQMRRFPQETLFVERLRAGRLGESDMDELARVLAAYHADAPLPPRP